MNKLGLKINKTQAWLVISLFWIIFYISRVLQDIAGYSLLHYKIDYYFTLVNYSGWLLWIPLTFLILRISRRYPIDRKGFKTVFFVHLLFAFLIAAVHYSFEAVFMYVTTHFIFQGRKSEAYFPYILFTLHLPILIYFLIVAIHQGLNYILKFQKEIIRNVELESKLFKAQNDALKMQIHPHFLFNTHHSIISLMMQDKKEDAIKMLMGLSDLLRKTLDLPRSDYVTVVEEISIMKLYLTIQETRFKDRLKVYYNIDQEASAARIPPFILQPLIENAIIHGIEPFSDSGIIIISAKTKSNRLELTIQDDGIGINGMLKKGIGLSNIQSRLKNYYNGNHTFEIKNRMPKGTIVTLELPLTCAP